MTEKGATSVQPDAYVKLIEHKTTLEAAIGELVKKTSKEANRRNTLLELVANLNDAWHKEFQQIAASLNSINSVQSALKIQPNFKGDKAAFLQKLENLCKSQGFRKENLHAIADKYADFAEIYADLDEAAKLTKTKTDKFKELFWENLFDLLSFQIPNNFDVTYHGKPLKSHSLGQRASAMMLFLLSQNENDLLIIDQPEDDLDSQTIYEEVVKLLRRIKPGRQFIFATHNANFPVLGDAETVAAFAATDDAIEVASASIDTKDCQAKIVDIMEGGVEAFARRKTIYEIWNQK